MLAAVTSRVAAGENYHHALMMELTARHHPLRSVFNWRLPTLVWLNARPPSPLWGRTILILIGVAVIVLWIIVFQQSAPGLAVAAGSLVILVGVAIPLTVKSTVFFHEMWAGLLIAASLACWGIGQRKVSLVFAAAALAIRELALPYVVVMAAVAWWDTRRSEALAWAGVALLFAGFWAWHAAEVLSVMPAHGLQTEWIVLGGWPFVLAATHTSVFLIPLKDQWVAAATVPIAWAGFWYWPGALGWRLALTVTGYFALFMIAGRPDNWYWGFLVAPLLPLGFFGFFLGSRVKPIR